MESKKKRVAVVGAGVSGIAAANVWQRCGYEVVLFEGSSGVGGQWLGAYPGVTLQNTAPQYVFADFPWPFEPDRHPTGAQVLRYLEAAVEHFELDVFLEHRVEEMVEEPDGWTVRVSSPDGERTERFGYVVVAVGQYPADRKHRPEFAGEASFRGDVVHSVRATDQFDGRRVVVVGNGKTALDMASLAGERAESCAHVFRSPRWSIPDYLLGVDFTRPFFCRFGSVMMPSWVHESAAERVLHGPMRFAVNAFWRFIAALFHFEHKRRAAPHDAGNGIAAVIPPPSQFQPDLRSATAVAPAPYHGQVASGRIDARRAEVASFYEGGVELSDGARIECDVVALCVGNAAPSFPFLPTAYRELMEAPRGGAQLYRHLIHPDIPNVGFAGLNHGFVHIALVEMGSLWQVAAHRGDLTLPSREEMAASAGRVAAWKRAHTSFEPSCNYAISTRFQQYLDVILRELGLSPYRKLPNPVAELFARYSPADYRGVVETYLDRAARRNAPLPSLSFDT